MIDKPSKGWWLKRLLQIKLLTVKNASRVKVLQLLECFYLLLKTRKMISMNYGAAQAAEKHGDEWGLTWYFLWGIYTSIPTWTHSQISLAAAEALNLTIWNTVEPLIVATLGDPA